MATCFASLGEEVKVWNAVDHSLQEYFNLDRDSITDICWNHEGDVLARCNRNNSVNLEQFVGTKSSSSHTLSLPETHSLCIEYDSASRYLACGCSNGSLHICDTNSMKICKSFEKYHFPITSVRWNWNDRYLALGSKHGELFLYNVITGQASSPFKPVSSVAIQQLRYNPYRKASLVSADAMGVVALWDTNTRGHVHSFPDSHQAPASDLAFSPVNDYLMLSVGLDKRLIFYDAQNKRSINTVIADFPLTCVDMQDGGTIAVGTTKGKILFYDMRMSSVPVSSLQAHKSSVRRIIFNKKDEATSAMGLSSFQTQAAENLTPHHGERDQNQNQNDDWKLILDDSAKSKMRDLLSPLRNDSNTSGLSETNTSALKNLHGFLNQVFGQEDVSSSRKFSSGKQVSAKNSYHTDQLKTDFFSPCRDNVSANSNFSIGDLDKYNGSFINQIFSAAGSKETSIDQRALPREDPLPTQAASKGFDFSSLVDKYNGSAAETVSASAMKSKSHTPPRNSSQRGVGASPSLHDISTNQHMAPDGSPGTSHTSPVPASHAMNGSFSSAPHRKSSSKTVTEYPSLDHHNASEAFSSPRSPRNRSLLPRSKVDAEGLEGVFSDLRHMFKTLLAEHTTAISNMKAEMKSDIRAMMSNGSGAYSLGAGGIHPALMSCNDGAPSLGDLLRQIVREELIEVKEKIHQEMVQSFVTNHRMYYQLQLAMQQGFRELAINPALVEEIERLKLEIQRLKSLY